MLRLSSLGVVGSLVLAGGMATAQEIVEIDMESGRAIIDSEYRSLYSGRAVVDWDRGLLYGDDNEEPEGIMVFSLKTGEWVRTIRTPRGDGPGEFSNGRTGMALAPDGGLYVSGYVRVIEFDSLGARIRTWSPTRPPTRWVCNFGNEPAVPTQGGVVRRGPNYEDQKIGPVRTTQGGIAINAPREDALGIGFALLDDTRIACSEDAAFVFTAQDNEPGTLLVYRMDGTVDEITVPPEEAREGGCAIREIRNGQRVIRRGGRCQHWSRRAQLTLDEHGNLVLLGAGGLTHGAIINPETGCYALIRARTRYLRAPVAIRGDSALVFHHDYTETVQPDGGIARTVRQNSSVKVTMNPIRRHGGEPCEGILPGVPPADQESADEPAWVPSAEPRER